MLDVQDLHASYDKVTAVRGVTVSATVGRVTLVLGANGAGKSTTLRTIAGLHKPDSGRVTLNGEDITGVATHKVVAKGLVLVPEGRRVFGPLSVLENLTIGGYAARGDKSATLQQVYELFPILADRRASAAGLLSGGEQQMLAFGRAMMSQPKVMMLDEPSMGLAPAVVDNVLTSVRTIADSGIAVLMVEQNAQAGLEVADDVVAMVRGQVIYTGPAQEARSHSSVLSAFLGEAALTD